MSNWIPILATLAGTLIGSLISYFATVASLGRQEKSDKREILISKLEEAYQIVNSIETKYDQIHIALTEKILFGEAASQNEEEIKIDYSRLNMICNFYFPELLPAIENLNIHRRDFGSIIAEMLVINIKRNRPDDEILININEKFSEIQKACLEVRNALILSANKRLYINK